MGVGGQRRPRSGQVRKISPPPFFDPRTAYFIETQFYISVYAKLQVQFLGRYPGLRLGKMAISTAVTCCRETGSV
jgi:hypothetical protein